MLLKMTIYEELVTKANATDTGKSLSKTQYDLDKKKLKNILKIQVST